MFSSLSRESMRDK